MRDHIQAVHARLEDARLLRKKGDALRKAGREPAARDAYGAGVAQLVDARALLRSDREQLESMSSPLSEEMKESLGEIVEVSGALGGMYQRLGSFDEACASYEDGSVFEEKFRLASTYNRLNAVKLALLTGRKRLADQLPKIRELATLIDASIRTQSGVTDSAWALADLADCQALLGETDEAGRSYAKFVAKAETKSPERTLDVLKEIASKLRSSGDPDAARVQGAVETLEARLLSH